MNKEERDKLIVDDIRKYGELELFGKSKGGKVLIEGLKNDVAETVDQLCNYKKLSERDLLSLCSDLNAKTTLLKILSRAKDNKDAAIDALKD